MQFKNLIAALLLVIFLVVLACEKDEIQPKVISASTNIQSAIDEYKSLLGADNLGDPGTKGTTGFREVNWDGLTDAESAPNLYTPDLMNNPSAPRARGIVLSTPGTGLMVCADSINPTSTPASFGNFNPTYTKIFRHKPMPHRSYCLHQAL